MKRSNALRPLSVEHHHALVQVTKLQKALKEKSDLTAAAKAYLLEWDQVIEPHFNIEEEVLIAPYIKLATYNQQMTETFYAHHQELREIAHQLKSQNSTTPQQIERLAGLMKEHIRFEERIFFPEIERTLDQDQLIHIGQETQQRCTHYES